MEEIVAQQKGLTKEKERMKKVLTDMIKTEEERNKGRRIQQKTKDTYQQAETQWWQIIVGHKTEKEKRQGNEKGKHKKATDKKIK